MENNQISKEKFVLVQSESIIYDEGLKTKSISYYKDAWLRFKKNKASVTAFIILVFLIIMAIIGPWFSNYELADRQASVKWAERLKDIPPRVEGLEWLGLDGYKEITNYPMYFANVPRDIIIKVKSQNAVGQITVVVDYYKWVDHFNSSYLDPETQTFQDRSFSTLSIEEYNKAREMEQETGETIILQDAPLLNGTYRVRVDYFKFLEHVYGLEEVNFWFGSDGSGRDLFTLMWEGARISLMIAFGVAIINIIVGVIVGSISGYYGGTIDLVIERLSEILSGLPFLAILTLLLLRYGNEIWVVILAFTLTGWLGISALTRAQFYRYKNREYVLAARTLGARDRRIMYRHILPNAVGTLITSLVLYIPAVIFSESTFSFLGIISYADQISIGRLLSNGQAVMKESFYQVLFPAIFISALMLSFNLFGNGLRDAFNPSLRGVEE